MLQVILTVTLVSNLFIFTVDGACPSALKLVTIDRNKFVGKNWFFVLSNQVLKEGTTICEEILYQNVNYNANVLYTAIARKEFGPQGSTSSATMNDINIADTPNGTVLNFNDGTGNLNIAAVNYDEYYVFYACNNMNGNVVLDVYSTKTDDIASTRIDEIKKVLSGVNLGNYANFTPVARAGCKKGTAITLNGGGISISQ